MYGNRLALYIYIVYRQPPLINRILTIKKEDTL